MLRAQSQNNRDDFYMLTKKQTVALFRSFGDFIEFDEDMQNLLADVFGYAMGGPTPKDPDAMLFQLIDILGSEHRCIGKPGEAAVTEAFIVIIRDLIRLSDAKASKKCTGRSKRSCATKAKSGRK
jgi:hypothetical protein